MAAPVDTVQETPAPARERPARSFLAELPVLVIVAVVLALLLKTFLVQAFYIPSASMVPTLEIGDRVLVNKVVYDVREPRRGEVVVFREEGDIAAVDTRSVLERARDFVASGLGAPASERDFIKRIIGLPGETVEMRDDVVYIDGQPLSEELTVDGGYLNDRGPGDYGPTTVPEGSYFMMGDFRTNSSDSRYSLGTIEREDLIGRAFVVIWPFTRADTLPIADYPPARQAAAAPRAAQ